MQMPRPFNAVLIYGRHPGGSEFFPILNTTFLALQDRWFVVLDY